MWLIQPVPDENVEEILHEVYKQDIEKEGYIKNVDRAWSHRPEMHTLWTQLLKATRSHLRLRTYELVTLAAARSIGCVYCMMAHGEVLHKNGFSVGQIISILEDYHNSDLTPEEIHMMDYASKISRESGSVTQADIDVLRNDGLSDQQITDIALAVVARNYISRYFDAIGARTDIELQSKEPELWEYLQKDTWRK
jgi:uncharacterized peroxidase-related enzyme